MVIIHVAGFQTVAIFMQTGVPDKSADANFTFSDTVEDSSHKVCCKTFSLIMIVDTIWSIL